jgi:hypothetical protein
MKHANSFKHGLEALGKGNTKYRVGIKVPESGVYEVIHRDTHMQKHEVTCIKGTPFPPCRKCGKDVEFRLVHAAIHIERHSTFP